MKNTETAKQESTNDYNLENIEPFRPRPHFEIDNRGVWWVNVRTDKDGDIIELEPQFLSDLSTLSARGKTMTARIIGSSNSKTKSHANKRPPPYHKQK